MYDIGHYIPGDSVIHRLDPRVKIGSVIGLSIMILRGDDISCAVMSVLLAVLIPSSRLTLRQVGSALRPVMFFILLLFFVHLLFSRGKAIPPFPSWRITVTYEGLYNGVLVSWQFMLLVLNAAILTLTTSPSELISGMERIFRPLKIIRISSHDIALMISISLRFVPTLLMEIRRMKDAQMARGANFKTGTLIQRAAANISLLIPLIMRTLQRADELVTAMEGRGYERGPRTYMRELRLTCLDYLAF
jgi:biotin transport system permease protein